MEINTSRVVTDEHLDAIKRLAEPNLSNEEFEEILQQLPKSVSRSSKEQNERISKLESEGRIEEALTEAVSLAFALNVTEHCILANIHGRLAGLANLPDQMAELERIAQTEMHSEIADIKSSLADSFPLPTREVMRLYRNVLNDRYELLEKEFNLQRRRRERKEALGISELNAEYELTRREKLLAGICPLFRDATPPIQQKVWCKLGDFTRKQWALFVIEADSRKNNYSSKAGAVKTIIKPIAKIIEEISGLTNMRGISFEEGSLQYRKDLIKVQEIVKILKADAVMRKNQIVIPNRTLTES